ncbi:hypothetical protein GCM10009527_048840 [Actinomadura nitritigenes]
MVPRAVRMVNAGPDGPCAVKECPADRKINRKGRSEMSAPPGTVEHGFENTGRDPGGRRVREERDVRESVPARAGRGAEARR